MGDTLSVGWWCDSWRVVLAIALFDKLHDFLLVFHNMLYLIPKY